MTAAELAEAEIEFLHPLTSEEFSAKVATERAAELRRTIIEAATAAGEPCPWWIDKTEEDLSPEQVNEIESWVRVHLVAVEADATPSVDSEGLSVPTCNDTTEAPNVAQR